MQIRFTDRGFARAEFTDRDGDRCSIELIPLLQRFVATGSIAPDENDPPAD